MATLAGVSGLCAYAGFIEPEFMLDITRYSISPQNWPVGLSLKIVVITDIHACQPWMPPARIRHFADIANALQPDIVALLGDFTAGHRFVTGPVVPDEWSEALSILKPSLGIYAVLGNHDWWHGPLIGTPGDNGDGVRRGLKHMRTNVMENDAVLLSKDNHNFWILGLGDQIAQRIGARGSAAQGVDDLHGTLAKVQTDDPVILLAHEPYVFSRVPERICLTLCGHTHGGQVNLPFYSLETGFGMHKRPRYPIYGHVEHGGKHIVVSAGLGNSGLPVRFRRPPEIVEVVLSGPAEAGTNQG